MRCVSGGCPGCVLISMSGGLSVYFRLVCSSVCVFRFPCLFLIDSVLLSHWLKYSTDLEGVLLTASTHIVTFLVCCYSVFVMFGYELSNCLYSDMTGEASPGGTNCDVC